MDTNTVSAARSSQTDGATTDDGRLGADHIQRRLDRHLGRSPAQRGAAATVAIVMDNDFFAKPLDPDHETLERVP